MPHAHPSTSTRPDRANSARPTDPAPAIQSSPVCPTCGRSPAVVFPVLRIGTVTAEAPLVCLACCPKPPGESPGR
jgi:hypothetical protein